MKPSSQFVIHWLKNITKKYPSIHFKYVYEPYDNTHYIFTHPIEEYTNGNFGKEASQFELNDFYNHFPNEDIGFISMNSFDNEIDGPLLLYDSNFNSISLSIDRELAQTISELLIKILFSNKKDISNITHFTITLNPNDTNKEKDISKITQIYADAV